MIDEQGPAQVVYFMLDDTGKPVFGIKGNGFTVKILGLYMDFLESLNLGFVFKHAQAALFPGDAAFSFGNDRVDKGDEFLFFFVFADIDDNDLFKHADLVGRQAYPRGIIHGFTHVGRQLFQGLVKNGDRPGFLPQDRFRVCENFFYRHGRSIWSGLDKHNVFSTNNHVDACCKAKTGAGSAPEPGPEIREVGLQARAGTCLSANGCVYSTSMNNLCPEIDKARLAAGMELLRHPVLPLVSMLQFIFLTGPFATVAEVIDEMPEPIETQFALYSRPRSLLRRHEGSLRMLESIKNSTVPEVKVVGENGDRADAMTTLSSLCLQQVLTRELEEINSLLCAPCGCDLCCVGPASSMKQEFFEIPLADSETDLFAADRLDTKNSRSCTARTEPPLVVEGRPFYKRKAPGLFHWRDGWSLILPKSSSCPNLEAGQGRCQIYENRPKVCRRPQIFPYILEKETGSGPQPVYRLQNSLLAVIDCPYVSILKDEIATYGAACELDVIFTQNKA